MKLASPLFLAALLVLGLPALAAAQHNFPSFSICDVRLDNDNDCSADAAATADTVCIQGVVVAWQEYGVRGPGAIWDPVNDCCISIYDIDLAGAYNTGDLVEVCGWVGAFSGLDEIIDDPVDGANDPSVQLISTGNAYPTTAITALDMADGSATAEALESCLVDVCGTFVLAGGTFDTFSNNYQFVDANGDTCEVRVDSDTGIQGTAIPAGSVTVTGVLAQFDNFGANVCGGYQLLPRSLSDLTPTTCTVAVEDATWTDVKTTYRDED
jgi:hypothetical protein